MATIVFIAVISAALLHAVWNALVKGGRDQYRAMTAVVLGHVPFACLVLLVAPTPNIASLPYLMVGVMLHVGYQFFLLSSYRVGDFTQVYPIARGSAPLIVAIVSFFVLGVDLRRIELLSVLIIGLGIMSLAFVRQQDGLRNTRAALLALGTGCFIAGYSLVDGMGARVAGTALGFYGWLAIGNAFVFAAITWFCKPDMFRCVLVEDRKLMLLGGGSSFAAYALVVWSFTQAPIALVTALRETSIIFALLIGVFFLKERLSLVKLVSTMVTLMGAALIRFSRT